MRWTALFIPTLREDPAEAKNAIHRLLIRAGYMRRQDYLFLGARVLRKLAAMVREEMDAIGAQEILTSSPRGMREIAGELRSYKQLPQIWYEFDGFTVRCWSFGDPESRAAKAFHRVFDRCAVHYSASAGALVAPSQNGDSKALEWAESRPQPPAIPDPEGDLSPEEFPTPGQKTIADLSAFTGLPETSQMKSVAMVFDQKPVLVMLRGDHQLSEAKLRLELCAKDLRPANAQEIREWLGADAGSLGPVGVRNMPILADEALRGRRNLACGANRNEYHLRHVTPGEDFSPEYLDLRMAASGDPSNLEGGALSIETAITLGRMRPGSRLHGFSVTDESGNQREVAVGAAESFLEHLVNAAVEQQHDGDGLALAASIAPFAIVLTPVSDDEAQQRTARELYDALRAAGIDALLDDRDERPGVKFKDADLIGIPYRVTVGKKLAQGMIEIRDRRARASEDVAVAETVSFLTDKLK